VKQLEVRTSACTRTMASEKLITFANQIIQQKLAVVVQESPQKFTVRYDFRNAQSAILTKRFNSFKEELWPVASQQHVEIRSANKVCCSCWGFRKHGICSHVLVCLEAIQLEGFGRKIRSLHVWDVVGRPHHKAPPREPFAEFLIPNQSNATVANSNATGATREKGTKVTRKQAKIGKWNKF